MLTTNERLDRLEEEIERFRNSLSVAGAMSITLVQTVLDELVDERVLAASVRTEIFGRIRKELPTFQIGCLELARGAERALPRYPTKVEREAAKRMEADVSRLILKEEREILRPRARKPETDR